MLLLGGTKQLYSGIIFTLPGRLNALHYMISQFFWNIIWFSFNRMVQCIAENMDLETSF